MDERVKEYFKIKIVEWEMDEWMREVVGWDSESEMDERRLTGWVENGSFSVELKMDELR